jgi:hypothetical protein
MDPAPGLFKPGAGFLRDKAGEWAATASLSERGQGEKYTKRPCSFKEICRICKNIC